MTVRLKAPWAGQAIGTLYTGGDEDYLLGVGKADVETGRGQLLVLNGTSYTLRAGDAGRAISTTSASAVTIRVPSFSFQQAPFGILATIRKDGAGNVTVQADDGSTIASLTTLGQTAVVRRISGTQAAQDGGAAVTVPPFIDYTGPSGGGGGTPGVTLGALVLAGSLTQGTPASGVTISGATAASSIALNIAGLTVGGTGTTRTVSGTPGASGTLTGTEALAGATNSPRVTGLGNVAAASAAAGAAPTTFATTPTVAYHPNSQASVVTKFGDRITACPDRQGLAALSGLATADGSVIGPVEMTDALGRKFWRLNGAEYATVSAALNNLSNRSYTVLMVGRVPHVGTVQMVNPRYATYTDDTTNTNANASIGYLRATQTSSSAHFLQAGLPAGSSNATDGYKSVPGTELSVMCICSKTGSTRIYYNNDLNVIAQQTSSAPGYSGLIIGGSATGTNSATSLSSFDLYEFAFWRGDVADSAADALAAAAVSNYAIAAKDTILLIDGDSTSYGIPTVLATNPANHGSVGSWLTEPGLSLVPSNVKVVNLGASGNQTSNLVTKRDATNSFAAAAKYPGGPSKNRVVVQLGQNDFAESGGKKNSATMFSDLAALFYTGSGTGYLERGWTGALVANIGGPNTGVTTNVSPSTENTVQKRIEGLRSLIVDTSTDAPTSGLLNAVQANSGQTYAGLMSVLSAYKISIGGKLWFDHATTAADYANATPAGPYDTDGKHLVSEGYRLVASGGDTPQHGYRRIALADATPSLAPAQDWRMAPTAANDSAGDAALVSALTGSGDKATFPSFAVANGATRTITLDIPAVANPGGLAYFIATQALTVTAERSTDSGATYSALAYTPQVPSGDDMARRGQSITIPVGGASKLRLTFANASGASATVNLKLHQRPATGRADAWMVNGASLERGDLDSLDMWNQWRSQFTASDPVFFSYAVGGASATQVRSYTAAAITGVPVADYFLLDVGGNGVTSGRPYATDPNATSDTNYAQMIDAVQAAGKIALPTRLTYRNYLAPNAVNGAANQENGSLPYNLNVYDGLIQSKFAAAYDTTYLIPRMDWYSLTLRYREELADEVHHTDALKVRSRALWSDVYGRYVYQGMWPVALVEQFVAAAETNKTDLNYSRAKEVASALPSSSGKTVLLNRLAALTSAPVNTVAPTLSGTFAVGETVSGTPGTWSGFPSPAFTYQWFADGVAISGAAAASYLLTSNETGKVIKRRTTATNDAGSVFADSPNSAAVAASSGNDPLTTSFLARMTAQPSSAKISKIDALMKVLKNLNRDSFVMYAMHDQQAALLDWFRDGYNHTLAGTAALVFAADQGFTGPGAATGYIRTNKAASTMGNLAQNSASIGFGVRTLGTGAIFGRGTSGTPNWAQVPSSVRLGSVTSGAYNFTSGNFVMTRSDAAGFTVTRDQDARVSFAATSETLDTSELFVHRANTSYGSNQITHFHAGPALTVDQEHTLNAAIVAFLS